jgi:hypothetical protein
MARMSLDGTFDEKTIAKKYATLFRQEKFFKS